MLEPVGESRPDARSHVHVLTYPAQEHKLRVGDAPRDLATGGGPAGTIVALDREARLLELRRGPGHVVRVGHRGAAALAPENSLEAIEVAVFVTTLCTPPMSFEMRDCTSPVRVRVKKASDSRCRWR